MKRFLWGIWLIGALAAGSCNEKSQEEEALCACVQTEAWIESRSLSSECVQLCISVFGTDMQEMHDWFAKNCEYEFEPLPAETEDPPQKI